MASSEAPAAVEPKLVQHSGSCHCGAVEFDFDAPEHLVAWDCNCSVCAMKRNVHVMVPKSRFRLRCEPGQLTEYRFNTKVAVHTFCKTCGVQSMYSPRSNPDCWAVTIHCLKPGTAKSVTIRTFDGKNWESFFKTSGISAFSGPAADAAVEAAPSSAAAAP